MQGLNTVNSYYNHDLSPTSFQWISLYTILHDILLTLPGLTCYIQTPRMRIIALALASPAPCMSSVHYLGTIFNYITVFNLTTPFFSTGFVLYEHSRTSAWHQTKVGGMEAQLHAGQYGSGSFRKRKKHGPCDSCGRESIYLAGIIKQTAAGYPVELSLMILLY